MDTRPEISPTALLDWKRRVQELYAGVRSATDPEAAWRTWRQERDDLFRSHAASPLPEEERSGFQGLAYFDYDPLFRVEATFVPASSGTIEVQGSIPGRFDLELKGRLAFSLPSGKNALDALWVPGYGGGLFVPVRDRTSGVTTYGGGRYILDTIKGADLGAVDGGRFLLDLNFAYNPSCSYDPRWACPLAPPGNHLEVELTVGERNRPAP